MRIAYDIFAETNPAYCACVLAKFVKAFVEVDERGPELPLAYLVLPVVLSDDLASTFNRTSRRTNLIEWCERNPQIQVGLPGRVNSCAEIVSDALRFSFFMHILRINNGARLHIGLRDLKRSYFIDLSKQVAQPLERAKYLGYWFADAGSTKTVLNTMGVTV